MSVYMIVFSGCAQYRSYENNISSKNSSARIYIYRPYQNTLSLWKYRIELYKFRDDYRKSMDKDRVDGVELKNGEYAVFDLDQGFYYIEMPAFKDAFKIVNLKSRSEYFYKIEFFNTGFLKRADVYIRQKEKWQAEEDLSMYGGMFRKYKPD